MITFLLILPAVIIFFISFGYNEMYPAAPIPFNEICLQDPSWTILYCVLSGIYLVLYIVFAGLDFRFLRKGGVLIWFAGFSLIAAFIFFSFDAAVGMYDQIDRLSYQSLMLFVILIVFFHSILVFRFSMTTREEKVKKADEFEIEYGLLQLDREAAPLPSLKEYPQEIQSNLGQDRVEQEPKEEEKQPKNIIAKWLANYFRLKQDRISMDDDIESEHQIESHYYIPSGALLFLPQPRAGEEYDGRYLYGMEFKPVDRNRINDILLLQSTAFQQLANEEASEEDLVSRLRLLKKYFSG